MPIIAYNGAPETHKRDAPRKFDQAIAKAEGRARPFLWPPSAGITIAPGSASSTHVASELSRLDCFRLAGAAIAAAIQALG